VFGHGVGAALLSVAAVNVLRAQSLAQVDFRDPTAVLAGLNETFDMEKQNQMYFTIWYGVYRRSTRELVHASGGHPPAVLLRAGGTTPPQQLNSANVIIGALPGLQFQAGRATIAPGDRLYVFSDGVYEVNYADRPEVMMSVEEFAAELARPLPPGAGKIAGMVDFVRRAQGREHFDDDFSLVEICFK